MIFRLTNTSNKVEAREGRGQDFKRHSARLFEHSIESLDIAQRRMIYDLTKDVALKIYSKESFHLDG